MSNSRTLALITCFSCISALITTIIASIVTGIIYLDTLINCEDVDYLCPPDNTTANKNFTNKISVSTSKACKKCRPVSTVYCQNPDIPYDDNNISSLILAPKIVTTDHGCKESGSISGIASLALVGLALIAVSCISLGILFIRCRSSAPRRRASIEDSINNSSDYDTSPPTSPRHRTPDLRHYPIQAYLRATEPTTVAPPRFLYSGIPAPSSAEQPIVGIFSCVPLTPGNDVQPQMGVPISQPPLRNIFV